MPDSKFILDTPPPFTVKQIFGAPEIDPAAQNIQDETLESLWTVQQFSEVNGKPWLALREHNLDGSIQRQFTGTSEEIAALTAANNISARPLPAVSEEHFYSHLLSSDRDYELGRQFAASSSQEIPYQLAPMDLDRFSAGRNDRLSEQQIRAENQVQLQPDERRQMVDVFEQYGLDTASRLLRKQELGRKKRCSKLLRPYRRSGRKLAKSRRCAAPTRGAKTRSNTTRKAQTNPLAWRCNNDPSSTQAERKRYPTRIRFRAANSAKSLHESCTDRARNRHKSCTKFAKKLRESRINRAEILHRSEPKSSQKVALRERQIGPGRKCCFAAHQLQRQATHYVSTLVYPLKTKHLTLCVYLRRRC